MVEAFAAWPWAFRLPVAAVELDSVRCRLHQLEGVENQPYESSADLEEQVLTVAVVLLSDLSNECSHITSRPNSVSDYFGFRGFKLILFQRILLHFGISHSEIVSRSKPRLAMHVIFY